MLDTKVKTKIYRGQMRYLFNEIIFWQNQLEQQQDTPEVTNGMGITWAKEKVEYYQNELKKVEEIAGFQFEE